MVSPTACVLYGASNYANNWIGINVLIILISMMVIALVFTISRLLPTATRSRVTEITKAEFSQIFISAIIIVAMMGLVQTACNISASMSQQITGTSQSPFQYADYYIGNLATNTGLSLVTNLYSTSLEYSVYAQVLGSAASFLNNDLGIFQDLGYNSWFYTEEGAIAKDSEGNKLSFVSVSVVPNIDLGTTFNILGALYVDMFTPMVVLTIGMLLVQYLALPVMQYAAFAVILPVALAMRSLSFAGGGLRNASNALLAIAIAAYIIYPLTVGFDGYMINWIFSQNNPSYPYLQGTYVPLNTITPNQFFSGVGGTPTNLPALVGSSLNIPPDPISVITQAQALVNDIAQFLFTGVVLFALNVAISIGFARGLANALNSGIEGATKFWSTL